MLRSLILAGAASLALAGCAMTDDMAADSASAMPGDMTPEQAAPYVDMAGASDLFEIQSSQIALSKAQKPEVRAFAQMLIEHHTMTTQQLTAAARASGMNPMPRLMPMQADMISRLQSASAGAAFDRLFVSQQVPAHQMALALHSNYAKDGDMPALRTVASSAVPIIQQHLDQARRLD